MKKKEDLRVGMHEKAEHQTFPHPNSDTVVDGAVKVPFVQPARAKHTNSSPSSPATASSASFG